MQDKGFTLVEIMIVVIIIAIIVAFSYPSYLNSVRKGNRKEAVITLTQMAALQEKFFLDRKSYAASITNSFTLTDCSSGSPGLGMSTTSEHGYYTLTMSVSPTPMFSGDPCAVSNNATSFTATATATSKGKQDEDKEQGVACNVLTLSSTGVKTPTLCW